MNTKFTQQIIDQVESAFNTCLASNTMSGQIAAKRAIELLQKTLEQSAEQYKKDWLKLDAEKQQESEYITAEQARELVDSGGEAEYFAPDANYWMTCRNLTRFPAKFPDFTPIKYRAIKAQPEPSDPHAALRAEYAKQVAEGTVGFYLWEYKYGLQQEFVPLDYSCFVGGKIAMYADHKYRCTDISCMVNKQGEPAKRMLRIEAQELQRSLGDTVEWSTPRGAADKFFETLLFNQAGTYTYAPKALKQVKWSDMPVGVTVCEIGQPEKMYEFRGFVGKLILAEETADRQVTFHVFNDIEIELAPASEQPWIPTIAPHEGLVVEYSKFSECMKITGIAKGYVLEGDV